MDPYKVLGVSEGASQEEIRRAYKALVKKYHPDQFTDNPLKELANEKLKEINQAYEALTKNGGQTRGGGSGGGYGGGASSYRYNTGYGQRSYTNYSPQGGSPEFAAVRERLSANDMRGAQSLLDSMSNRTAEWHYLYGVVYLRMGWYDQARQYFQVAYQAEPNNPEYRNAYASVSQNTGGFGGGGGGTGCEICQGLLCADCCCRCFGGNLCGC